MKLLFFFLFLTTNLNAQLVINTYNSNNELIKTEKAGGTMGWLYKNRKEIRYTRWGVDKKIEERREHLILEAWENDGGYFCNVLFDGQVIEIGFYKNVRMVSYTYVDNSHHIISGNVLYSTNH